MFLIPISVIFIPIYFYVSKKQALRQQQSQLIQYKYSVNHIEVKTLYRQFNFVADNIDLEKNIKNNQHEIQCI